MATVKDWALDAAGEIARLWITGSHSGEERVVLELRAVIVDHCPFEVDTAYMPVPRCETCKLWSRRDIESGWCGLREKSQAKLWPEAYDGLVTTEDFGCVQWEAK